MVEFPGSDGSESNKILKAVFQDLHQKVVESIDASTVAVKLFAKRIISNDDVNDLDLLHSDVEKCHCLLMMLHRSHSPRAFIELRLIISDDPTYTWLVSEIEEKYKEKVIDQHVSATGAFMFDPKLVSRWYFLLTNLQITT
jgi:hypothetical protein